MTDPRRRAAWAEADLTSLRVRLTRAPQQWLALCAAGTADPDRARALLAPGDDATRALADSPRQWPTRATGRVPPTGRGGDVLDDLDDLRPRESFDLSAAAAVAAVAASLAGVTTPAPAIRAASTHWQRACLPGFDSSAGLPEAVVARIAGASPGWPDSLGESDDVPLRGFLALLALQLVGHPPAVRHEVELSVLFDRRHDGGSGLLRLRLRSGGPAGLYPDPAQMCFLLADTSFTEAVGRAWTGSALRTAGHCVTWSITDIDEPCLDLVGGSLGAAFAVALDELNRRHTWARRLRHALSRRLSARCAVTGAVDAYADRLGEVHGHAAKLQAAREIKVRRVVVPQPSLADFARHHHDDDPFELRAAQTVREAAHHARTRLQTRLVVIAAVSVLVVVAGAALGAYARAWAGERRARQDTEQARQEATSRKLRAVAEDLLAQADDRRADDPLGALRRAIVADRIAAVPEARASIVNTVLATGVAGLLTGHEDAVTTAAFAPDGTVLATGDSDGTVLLWDVTDPGAGGVRLSEPLAHDRSVGAMAFSPDSRTLAVSDAGQTVLWDITDRDAPRRLGTPLASGGGYAVPVVEFSSDGRFLVTADFWPSVVGNGVVTPPRYGVQLWDMTDRASPRPVSRLDSGHTSPLAVTAFVAGGVLLTVSTDAEIVRWDLSDPARPRKLSAGPIGPIGRSGIRDGRTAELALSPDRATAAVAATDDTVTLWDISDSANPRRLSEPRAAEPGNVETLAFSPDGNTLALGALGRAMLWDVSDPAKPVPDRELSPGAEAGVWAVVFSPDGSLLATGLGGHEGTTYLWDVTGGAPSRLGEPLVGHTTSARSVAFSPDGTALATAGDDGAIELWDIHDRMRPTRTGAPFLGHGILVNDNVVPRAAEDVAFSPDGTTLATSGDDGTVALWDLTSQEQPAFLGELAVGGENSVVSAVAFSPTGTTIAAAGPNGLWDVADPSRPTFLGRTFVDQQGPLVDVEFSPNGRLLATGTDAGTGTGAGQLVLWDLADPRHPTIVGEPVLGHLGPVWTVAFAPDGATLAVADDLTTVVLWDVTDPVHPRRLGEPLTGHADTVHSMAYSPDGTALATASVDGTVLLWDVTDRSHPVRLGESLHGHDGPVWSVAFSPDGATLASAGDDGATLLWDMTELDAIRAGTVERACRIVGGGLTPEEWAVFVPDLPYQPTCNS
ncbi:hypothetical protein ACG83_29845 [Frankia sp. R43]|uniref:WD40 repeat domain-containing protein n=1 Tax=Frankia sp. R43 TaxID=269536 RepID=UPI0006C9EC4A|nr:WD40 repeat domain-containing protein [Frankia sp. R43]KPM52527.1 hypothetical protein ACG83_29845 [Frankia sp. R43]